MKKSHLLSTILLCVLTSCTPKNNEWKLVWSDDFNYETIDTTYWSKIPRGTSDWNNFMSDFDSCYALREGNLILRGIVNHSQKSDTARYLTGGVYTKGKLAVTGGRMEIRAKLQAARGTWPAIWMLPENMKWPQGGEIDIMERLNYDSIAYQTVHSSYTIQRNGNDTIPPHFGTHPINPSDYNIYSVDIYPDSLVFAVNGSHTFTYPRMEELGAEQYPFYRPYYLLIDMQIGGAWVGGIDAEDYPVEMWVDWVKYYQKEE